jgi:steroid 5-alpha reductase family enzyme
MIGGFRMRKKIANNQKIILVILMAIAFAVLMIVPTNNEAVDTFWGSTIPAPGGGIACYCEHLPLSCLCVIWK